MWVHRTFAVVANGAAERADIRACCNVFVFRRVVITARSAEGVAQAVGELKQELGEGAQVGLTLSVQGVLGSNMILHVGVTCPVTGCPLCVQLHTLTTALSIVRGLAAACRPALLQQQACKRMCGP